MRLLGSALAVVCAIVGAWFVLGVVQSRNLDQASNIVFNSNRLTPAEVAHVYNLLRTAGTLDPNHSVELLRAQALVESGRIKQGIRIAEQVTVREPHNLNAWLILAQLGLHGEQPVVTRAIAHLKALDPRLYG